MKKRSKATSKTAKARPGKGLKPKGRSAAKAFSHRGAAPPRETEVARLTRELSEALEQQTATSDVLRVISASSGELEPVFQAMLDNATRLCDAKFGHFYRWDGTAFHLVAMRNTPRELAEERLRSPLCPSSHEPLGRMVATKQVVHVADAASEPAYLEQRDPAVVTAVELGGIRTLLAVPMMKESELIGALTIYRQEVRPFTNKQVQLVTNFARAGRDRHRERTAADRATRIAATADCHR
jgi:two-component system, NtrC family, sensor kinase